MSTERIDQLFTQLDEFLALCRSQPSWAPVRHDPTAKIEHQIDFARRAPSSATLIRRVVNVVASVKGGSAWLLSPEDDEVVGTAAAAWYDFANASTGSAELDDQLREWQAQRGLTVAPDRQDGDADSP